MSDRAIDASPILVTGRGTTFDSLSPAELDAWHRLRAADQCLDSSYFGPGLAAAVPAAGHDVRVVVRRDGADEVRALPAIHRDGSMLRPVRRPDADFQGPIAAPGTTLNDKLLDEFDDFAAGIEASRPSPYVDAVGGGFGYLDRASSCATDSIGQAAPQGGPPERTGAVRGRRRGRAARAINPKRALEEAISTCDYFAETHRITGSRGFSARAARSLPLLGQRCAAARRCTPRVSVYVSEVCCIDGPGFMTDGSRHSRRLDVAPEIGRRECQRSAAPGLASAVETSSTSRAPRREKRS